MVVKLLSNDNLEELEKEINDYLIKTVGKLPLQRYPEVYIKVVQGFDSTGYWVDSNGRAADVGHNPKLSHFPYFIAVIQY